MQTWSSDEKAACLSVCPSNTCNVVHCDKTEEKSVQIFIPYERKFCLLFWEEEWLVGATPSTWNFGTTGLHWSEIADFEPIFACSTSALRPSKKSSVNTNRTSTTRFSMSLRWSYVAPNSPKGARKRKAAVFGVKSYFAWRKSATKFLCVKTVSNSCKAFIGLTVDAKMIGRGRPLLPEILGQNDPTGAKSPIL